MSKRYFAEIAYLGTAYHGFQKQLNAKSIQQTVDEALQIVLKHKIESTTSSRTDAGVHAKQNYLQFDFEGQITDSFLYNVNAILPDDIVLKQLYEVPLHIHARFDAIGRKYLYQINTKKNPFLQDRAWYYPYPISVNKLQEFANCLIQKTDFSTFAKKHANNKTSICSIHVAKWWKKEQTILFEVEGNRFLRGMVRGLVATQLMAMRKNWSVDRFQQIIHEKNNAHAFFNAPAKALFLQEVKFETALLKPIFEVV
ncbi:MAG: tRNA pseudouridine(38-40) synthase TruA [Chitinophagaceae bacterium]